jgi:hypothetical protein
MSNAVSTAPSVSDDQRLAVRGDHRPVREMHVFGGDTGCAVRRHIGQLGGGVVCQHAGHAPRGDLRVQVEAEVADIGSPRGIDDHVVAMEVGDMAQLRMDVDLPVRLAPQELAPRHGDDQHGAVGHPP